MPFIKGSNPRHLYSFSIGLMSDFFIYRNDVWPLLIFHVIVHRLIVTLKAKSSVICMVGMFGFLSFYHIMRMYLAYGSYVQDFTLVLMNQTTKVTYLAYAVHDYYTPEENLPVEVRGRKITHLPGLREYMSYNFTFIGWCGPYVDYKDYIDFIYEENNYANIRFSLKQFLKNMGLLIFCMGFFMSMKDYFPFDLISSTRWWDLNPISMVTYMVVAGFLLRHRYYIAFTYGQITADLAGITWNSENESNDLYRNFDWFRIESDNRSRDRLLAWNQGVQRWLKNVCYVRCNNVIGNTKAALLVFLLSAFWHGFYPSFYLVFATAFVLNENQKSCFKKKKELAWLDDSWIWSVVVQ